MTSNEIRRQFLDFFKGKGHTLVPSAPVVPLDDHTLMFANAGMNQFKDVFLGTGTRPYQRAANTQKCIRAGGKHNDLDDVGRDTYHHTFFEMLGNWSFGDYFKAEAIQWAWELLTEVWGIEKDCLHATYFEGDREEGLEPDEESARLWREMTDIDPAHVHPGGKKDNFWEMGDTGPCGPCSEIHIDLTPDKSGAVLVNAGDHRVIEIWNLVFIQFNRAADHKLTPLPDRHVDTGMGFERICAVLQGKQSNYDTDVWTPIFDAIRQRTGASPYTGLIDSATPEPSRDREGADQAAGVERTTLMRDVSYRVIADHLRCLTFALTDGAVPSNEGRGYVLRRILRRAVRYGRQYLDMHEPFLCDLVEPLVAHMADAFPELRTAHGGKNVEHVIDILRDEEESFRRTLDRGIVLFERAALEALGRAAAKERNTTLLAVGGKTEDGIDYHEIYLRDGSVIDVDRVSAEEFAKHTNLTPELGGEDAFELHATYGFPIDLTVQMGEEAGLVVDVAEYERLMEEARDHSRAARPTAVEVGAGKIVFKGLSPTAQRLLSELEPTDDKPKYGGFECEAQVKGWVIGGHKWSTEPPLHEGRSVVLALDRSCFYAEQGGQVGDAGIIETDTGTFEVQGTHWCVGVVGHGGVVRKGTIKAGQKARLRVHTRRRPTMRNHTATHLLNWALREVLGESVEQKGSLVDPEKTRFDFSYNRPLTIEELTRVEEIVTERIDRELPVCTKDDVDLKEAQSISGLRAVFGEKYADHVRVVSIGARVDKILEKPEHDKWKKYAIELCGGTHVANTREIERFTLISEEGVAKGIRRVVGITGQAAGEARATGLAYVGLISSLEEDPPAQLAERLSQVRRELAEVVIPVRMRLALAERLVRLQKRVKQAEKAQTAHAGGQVAAHMAELLEAAETVAGVTIVVGEVPAAPPDALRSAIDWVRNKTESSAVLLATVDAGKVTLVAGMSKGAVKRGLKAGDLIKEVAPMVGGKGGGRPDMAQGGGTDPERLPEALKAAYKATVDRLG